MNEGIRVAQKDIQTFHEALGIDVGMGERPTLNRPELRAELIREEAKETVEAIERGDFPEAVDGLVDTIVVCLGSAVEWGVDLQPFWDEVQRANLDKVGGEEREDGKRLKPPGWRPPEIKELLFEQIGLFDAQQQSN